MAKKPVKSRIFFGSLMIVVLGGLFTLDIRQFHRVDPETAGAIHLWIAGGMLIALVVGLLAAVATLEILNFAAHTGSKPFNAWSLIGSVTLAVFPFVAAFRVVPDRIILMSTFLIILVIAQMLRRETRGAGANLAWSLFAVVYIGLLFSFLVQMRTDLGPGPLLVLIAAIKFSDIGAYFTGMALGRHKLIPWLSPGKTIEGLIGAIIFSVIVTLSLGQLPIIIRNSVLADLHWTSLVVLGVIFAAAGHLGDLAESLLKRDAQVKDSAHLLPEFGGVLDLVDSLLPAGFIGYIILKYII